MSNGSFERRPLSTFSCFCAYKTDVCETVKWNDWVSLGMPLMFQQVKEER
jgi:hypothetical protein